MRFAIVLLICMIGTATLSAQQYSWLTSGVLPWGSPNNGGGGPWDITVDSQGNSFIAGKIMGGITWDNDSANGGAGSGFVSKFNNNGSLDYFTLTQGAQTITGTGAFGIGVDHSGNAVAGGCLNNGDLYVEKFDSAGASVWYITFNSNGTPDFIRDVEVDSIGNIYVVGSYAGNITLGSFTLNNPGSYQNIFLCKMNPQGAVLWAISIGGTNSSGICQEMKLIGDTALALTGSFAGSTDFGGPILTDSSTSDVYIATYDTSGNLEIAFSALRYTSFNSATINAISIAVDASRNFYVTGYYKGYISNGATTLQTTTNTFDENMFVAKFDDGGNPMWLRQGGSTDLEEGWAINVDECGNVRVFGKMQGCNSCPVVFDTMTTVSPGISMNSFMIKYNSNGYPVDLRTYVSQSHEQFIATTTSDDGNIYTTGMFNTIPVAQADTIIFDSINYVTTANTLYFFVGKINDCTGLNENISFTSVTPLCAGQTIPLISLEPGAVWSTGFIGSSIFVSETGWYWANLSTCNGCMALDSVYFNFTPMPIAGFTSSLNGMTANFTNSSVNANSFVWDFGDTSAAWIPNPSHTYLDTGAYIVTLIAVNVCGADTVYDTLYFLPTSVASQLSELNFQIYPNPTSEMLSIQSIPASYEYLSVYDENGKLKMRTSIVQNQMVQLQITDWESGIYTIELTGVSCEKLSSKVIKQ